MKSHDALWNRNSQLVRDDPAELIFHVVCELSESGATMAPTWTREFNRDVGAPLCVTQLFVGETSDALQQRLSRYQMVILCGTPGDEQRMSPWLYELLLALAPLHVGSRRTFVRELGIVKHHARPRSLAALRELVQQTCICTDEAFHSELWALVAEYAG